MRKIFLAILLLSSSLASAALNQAALMKAFTSVVMIRGYHENGSLGYGSGVIVAKNQIVTNCHVLRNTSKPWVSQGEYTFSITSVRSSPWHDLCLLDVHDLNRDPVPIGSSLNLKKGQELVGIGHSNGAPVPLTTGGYVLSTYPLDDGNVIHTSAKFRLGASGSGLFDLDGNLIGINTFKTTGYGSYYAVPVEWIKDLQQQNVLDEFPIQGKALWEEDEDEKPFFLKIAIPKVKESWDQVRNIATDWIKKEPNNSEAWFELAIAQKNLGNNKDYIDSLNKSLKQDKNNIDALFELALDANQKNSAQYQEYFELLSSINLAKAEELKELVEKSK
jgi:serine protease Do